MALTQHGRVLKKLQERGNRGATNYELSRIALKYTSVVSSLRQEGHNILAERQLLKNGRPSNTWRYYLLAEDDNRVAEKTIEV